MQATIKEKLNKIKEEYEFLEQKLNDSSVISNIDQFSKYNKQKAKLENKYQLYSKYLNLNEVINDSLEIIKNETDQQFIDLAKEELNLAKKEIETVEEKLIEMLVELDPNDSKDAIIEIKGAVGGDEANIFAGDLYRMYSRYASKNDWTIEIIDSEETDRGGFAFIIFELKGIDVYKHLKFESGVHRVQRVPQTETNGRVHTSTATVLVTPLHEEEEFSNIEIPQNEIRVDTYRASGAGGQHINKTDSAVRITHIPTGIVVSSQQGRSQHDNKDKAFKMLKSKILDLEMSKKNKEINEAKKTLVGAGERSEKIRTYNYQQNRVSDHRINLTLKKLDRVLQGNIEEIIEVLLASERELSN